MSSTGYSRTPKLLKGALVQFSSRLIGPVPSVILFQYNPESLSRKLTIWGNDAGDHPGSNTNAGCSAARSQSGAQPMMPTETINLSLVIDAVDAMEDPDSHPVESLTGIADRLAALELLLYPQEDSLVSGLLGSINGALGGTPSSPLGSLAGNLTSVPRGTVPTVLFVWGSGRIVPVRLTEFAVEEQDFSPLLYPIRAKVSIGMKILTPEDFPKNPGFIDKLAVTCYKYTKKQKELLAAADVANDVESILGMLPF